MLFLCLECSRPPPHFLQPLSNSCSFFKPRLKWHLSETPASPTLAFLIWMTCSFFCNLDFMIFTSQIPHSLLYSSSCVLWVGQEQGLCLDLYISCDLTLPVTCGKHLLNGCCSKTSRCLGWIDNAVCRLSSLQCLFGSPVHLNSSYGARKQPFPLALHCQPVQNKGHFLLLFSNGALHQRAWKPSGGAKGKRQLYK